MSPAEIAEQLDVKIAQVAQVKARWLSVEHKRRMPWRQAWIPDRGSDLGFQLKRTKGHQNERQDKNRSRTNQQQEKTKKRISDGLNKQL